MAEYNNIAKATRFCLENIYRKGKLFMNGYKRKSKLVKKDKILRFREFEKKTAALALASSFALMMTACGTAQSTYTGETSTRSTLVQTSAETEKVPSESKETTSTIVSEEQTTIIFETTEATIPEPPQTTAPTETDAPIVPDVSEEEETEERTEIRESVFFESIPYRTVYIDDDSLYDDENVVESEGANGTVKITIYSTYINGIWQSESSKRETISFSKERVIRRGTKPSITYEEKTITETVEKYSTIYEECDTMEIGTTKIKTEGKNSVATRNFRYIYKHGVLSETILISESISERVDEVILVGTKEPEQKNDGSFGMPFKDAAHGGKDYSVTQYFGSGHNALDFGVYYGEPIVSSMSGTVIAAYDEGYFSKDNILWTYGTYVVIQHEGYRTYYAHLSSRTVSVGDKVEKGQVIGHSGNTGRVNTSAQGPYAGTHLHFEIRKYYSSLGVYRTVDPTLYLPWWN